MINLKDYYSWEIDIESGFRKLVIKDFESPTTELEKFNSYDGETKKCPRCNRELPKNTYFFHSSWKRHDGLHGICKECEGSSFGWGRNKNFELQKIGKKYCKTCDRILPLNEIYFSKSSGKCNQKTGFASNCKECNKIKFGINSINSLMEFLDVKSDSKICTQCMLELPDTDDYFHRKNDRKFGKTICKKCTAKKSGRILTGARHLNVSKSHLLKDNEKFCTSCGGIFLEQDICRKDGIYLCDKCYKDRNKYNFEKRRTMRNNLLSDLTQYEWKETLLYFNNKCAYCGISEEECFKNYHKFLSQDHILALSKGGGFTKNNIVPACPSCNSSKNNMSIEDFYNKSSTFTIEMYEKIKNFIKDHSMQTA